VLDTVNEIKPREYQKIILNSIVSSIEKDKNLLVELDCGLGKRYLQMAILRDKFPKKKIVLLLQASSSLYETKSYLSKFINNNELGLIDSRQPSRYRQYLLKTKRVILSLPQTFYNTIKTEQYLTDQIDIVVINEVDQIIRRIGQNSVLRAPYNKLLDQLNKSRLIGMSGTIRDSHYIIDNNQLLIQKELKTLENMLSNIDLISMDSLLNSDLNQHLTPTKIIPHLVSDERISDLSSIIDTRIDEVKNQILLIIKDTSPELYKEILSDFSRMLGPLPIEDELSLNLNKLYLIRKYLWSMTGKNCYKHLSRSNFSVDLLKNIPTIPGKFLEVKKLIGNYKKSVIVCSYIDTVYLISELLNKINVENICITGKISPHKREESLNHFRSSSNKIVAILSNVGERDLDLPEADLLVIFDLIRTTKTMYQKLKRSRGGDCRILYYEKTKEKNKLDNLLKQISKYYPWSVDILPILE